MAKKIFKGLFGVAGSILGIKKKSAPAVVQPAAAPVIPMPDEEAITRAKKRSTAAQMARGGRTSTMLTDSSDTLGG